MEEERKGGEEQVKRRAAEVEKQSRDERDREQAKGKGRYSKCNAQHDNETWKRKKNG